jgi:hypothetical protein
VVDSQGYQVNYYIEYSPNEGSSWFLIISNLNETYYVWDTTTVENGENYKIRIFALGGEGEEISRTFEGTFSIDNIPPPQLEQALLLLFLILSCILISIIYFLQRRLRSVKSVLDLQRFRIGICIGKFGEDGLSIHSKNKYCPYTKSSLLSMLEYSAVLHQRGETEQIYGPFPHQKDDSDIEWYNVSYGFSILDSSVQDSRVVKSGGRTPALLLIFYPKQFDSLFMLQKREVEDFLKASVGSISGITEVSEDLLNDLGYQIYKLLLDYKPIKLDDVLPNVD